MCSAGKRLRASHDCFWFDFLLGDDVARIFNQSLSVLNARLKQMRTFDSQVKNALKVAKRGKPCCPRQARKHGWAKTRIWLVQKWCDCSDWLEHFECFSFFFVNYWAQQSTWLISSIKGFFIVMCNLCCVSLVAACRSVNTVLQKQLTEEKDSKE